MRKRILKFVKASAKVFLVTYIRYTFLTVFSLFHHLFVLFFRFQASIVVIWLFSKFVFCPEFFDRYKTVNV